MPDSTYPLFEDGQTLTAPDLNQLRDFLHGRDRLLGRMTGFGINCGLGGTVSGATLTIGAGLAIDQVGEPLLLAAPETITLPPTNDDGDVAFAFIEPTLGDLSIVLESIEDIEEAPDCGDADCEGHAEQHTRAVALRAVPGRLTGAWFDFAGDALLDVEPIRLSLTSQPQGSYETLRNAIADRLDNGGNRLIDPALILKLRQTVLSASDLPGVKGYKAGFINQVLFATLDLLRCRALMAIACDRATPRPGVVLGWLKRAGSVWSWDCEYRHAWEPPRGLTQAFIGGTCTDPCGMYQDEVEALIAGYAPPDPPPPSTGTGTGPGPVVVVCPHGYTRTTDGRCLKWLQPKKEINPDWKKVWVNPRDPRWNPPRDYRQRQEIIATEIYQVDPLEFFGQRTFSTLEALGWKSTLVETAVTDTVTQLGGKAHIVTVSTEAELAGIPGFTSGNTFNVGDTVVMVVDARDNVSAFGRVAGAQIARDMGAELPGAVATAGQALRATAEHQAELVTVTNQVSGLKDFERATLEWRDTMESTLEQVDTVIAHQVQEQVGMEIGNLKLNQMVERLASAEGSLDVLVKLGGAGGIKGLRADQRLDVDFARGMVEFAETVNAGLGSLVTDDNQKTLGRYVGEATRAAATLEVVAAGGDPIAIGDAAVTLMGTLRTAVKSTGIDAALGRQLDAQLNAVKGMLG